MDELFDHNSLQVPEGAYLSPGVDRRTSEIALNSWWYSDRNEKTEFIDAFKALIGDSTDFAAYDMRQPFHFQIDNYMLHVEPAYRKVSDLRIDWKADGTDSLFRYLREDETFNSRDEPGILYKFGIFNFAVVPATDISNREWESGSNHRCGTCAQWFMYNGGLKSPNRAEQNYLLERSNASNSGFCFLPISNRIIPWVTRIQTGMTY
ncbi:hypothetical protein F5X99DRAFT_403695 [Biscogniauxia marginata]|nr:hypothetical protein F5X99DRAFT_403695 [Biscogniauxia marginata]